jgi:hypothetical protein
MFFFTVKNKRKLGCTVEEKSSEQEVKRYRLGKSKKVTQKKLTRTDKK